LPKALRKQFVPVPEHAARLVASAGPADGPLLDVVTRRVAHTAGEPVPSGTFRLEELDPWLRMNIRVLDTDGTVLGEGRDLAALQAALRPRLRATLRHASASLERHGCRSWCFGEIEPVVVTERDGKELRGYPAIVDEGDAVGLRLLSNPDEQAAAHWEGTRRLLRLTTPGLLRALRPAMGNELRLAAARLGLGVADLAEDIADATLDGILAERGGPVWDGDAFEALRGAVAAGASSTAARAGGQAAAVVVLAATVRRRLDQTVGPQVAGAVADMRLQLDDLVHPGFVGTTGLDRLGDLLRYLRGIERRVDRAVRDPHGDRARMARVHALEQEFDAIAARWAPGTHPVAVTDVRWLLEELRVALFAEVVGTAVPVSENRVRAALGRLRSLD
jgi:ATP-dependent helicase HrpA